MSVSFAHDSENLFDTKAGTARGWQKTENSCLKIRDDLRAAPGFGAGRGKISCGKAGRQRGCSAWGGAGTKGGTPLFPSQVRVFLGHYLLVLAPQLGARPLPPGLSSSSPVGAAAASSTPIVPTWLSKASTGPETQLSLCPRRSIHRCVPQFPRVNWTVMRAIIGR